MRLNMGCGRNKMAGFVNVDSAAQAEPDQVWDLERTPWPWPSDSAEEVLFNHALEHMGADPKVFLAIVQELYRICAPDAVVDIRVPHPRHDNFIGDPTHVRIVTPQLLELLDRERNAAWKAAGASNTPLALYLDVDFTITDCSLVLAEPYRSQLAAGETTAEAVHQALRSFNNVGEEWRIRLKARKPRA